MPAAFDRLDRVVVGSIDGDETARLTARALLMAGREVVFVGSNQRLEQIASTVVAEDAGTVLLDAPPEALDELRTALIALGRPDVDVKNCGE